LHRPVILTGRWDAQTRARVQSVANALAGGGANPVVVAPASPSDSGLGDGIRFIPARRRDDAAQILDRLAQDGILTIECHDPGAARCALAWRDATPGRGVVLIDAVAAESDPEAGRAADAVLASTVAHARRTVEAGVPESRVIVTPLPVAAHAAFEPGADAVLCATPIAPGRGLIELIDAWAASVCGTEDRWLLRFCGPVEDTTFALELARRAASCAGVRLSERLDNPEDEIAGSAVLIDPSGDGCPCVLRAVVRGRAVFAPAGSPTAEAACKPGTPFAIRAEEGLRGLIGAFDLLSDHDASAFAAPGRQAREHLLRVHASTLAVNARLEAYARAGTSKPPAGRVRPDPLDLWGERPESRQNARDTARLQRAMLACHSEGLRRIALYGAGGFVKGCAEALCEPPVEIIGFIDDDPAKRGRRVWGYPVLCSDVALTADLDAVILAAPSCETELWQRTAWFRQARIRVIPLVRQHADLPAARAA